MRKFKALLVLNLKAMLNSFRMGGMRGMSAAGVRRKDKRVAGYGGIVLIAFLGLYLSGIYSFLFASQLAPLGQIRLLIMMMPVLVVGMGMLFTVFAAQGVLFGGKDNDIVLALPIPPFTLLLARTLALYLENLLFALFVMAPAAVAYLMNGGPGGVGFVLRLIVLTIFLALLPTTLDILVGYVLAWASGRFAGKKLITNVLYFAAFLLFMVFIMRLNFTMNTLTAAKIMGIEQGFSVWGAPFVWLMEAACDGSLMSFALFLFLCAAPFFLVVYLFAGSYKKIVTSLSVQSSRSDYKLGRVAAVGSRRALLSKESSRFFGTPIYLFNTGMGLVMMLVGGVASIFFKAKVAEVLGELMAKGAGIPIAPLLTAALAFFVGTVAITASSISLEGRNLWILKESPIRVEEIFAIKVGFQILMTLPVLLLATLCFAFAFSLGPVEWLVTFLVPAVWSVFCALFGLFVNLNMPKLDSPSDTLVVKQSGASFTATMVPMLLVIGLGALWIALQGVVGETPALLLLTLLPVIAAAVLVRLLNTKGKQLWLAL